MEQKTIFKIVVTGDGAVGKTALLLRFVTGKFVTDTTLTIGVQLHSKSVMFDDQEYLLQLWDLGGQERFRFILPSYIAGAKGALLLYDLTRMTSLDTLEEWVSICRTHNKGLPILLCGTKADLANERSVPSEYVCGLLQSHALCDHIEISALSGLNVEKAFELLVKEIVSSFSQ